MDGAVVGMQRKEMYARATRLLQLAEQALMQQALARWIALQSVCVVCDWEHSLNCSVSRQRLCNLLLDRCNDNCLALKASLHAKGVWM